MKIATLDVAFAGMNEATLTFTEATASSTARIGKAGRSSTRKVRPQFPKQPTYVPPKFFTGVVSYNFTTTVKQDVDTTTGQGNVALNAIVWKHNADDAVLPYDYDMASATMAIAAKFVDGFAGGSCTTQGSVQLPVGTGEFDIKPGTSIMSVDGYKKYFIDIDIPTGQQPFVSTQTCDINGLPPGDPRMTYLMNPEVKFNFEGTVVKDAINSSFKKTVTSFDPDGSTTTQTLTVGWNFQALRTNAQ